MGRFVDRLEKVDRVVVVGATAYRRKYDNKDPATGTVVAQECALINARMRGPEHGKASLVPILLEGTPPTSLPPSLHDSVFADFRKPDTYFPTALNLLFSLYQIEPQDPIAVDIRKFLEHRLAGAGESAFLDAVLQSQAS